MLILKGCPRCRGDLKVDRDHDGPYLLCLQCGYIKDLKEDNSPIRVRVRTEGRAREKEPVAP